MKTNCCRVFTFNAKLYYHFNWLHCNTTSYRTLPTCWRRNWDTKLDDAAWNPNKLQRVRLTTLCQHAFSLSFRHGIPPTSPQTVQILIRFANISSSLMNSNKATTSRNGNGKHGLRQNQTGITAPLLLASALPRHLWRFLIHTFLTYKQWWSQVKK